MTRFGSILASLGLLLTVWAGTAFATVPTILTDDGVDYTDTDVSAAYLAFAMEGDTLIVSLDDDAGSDLPAIAFTIPAVERYDVFGNEVGADLGMIEDVSVERGGTTLTSLEVTHPDADLHELADAYLTQLAALGFETDVRFHTNHNVATLEANNADGALRVVLHRSAGGVDVHLFQL